MSGSMTPDSDSEVDPASAYGNAIIVYVCMGGGGGG